MIKKIFKGIAYVLVLFLFAFVGLIVFTEYQTFKFVNATTYRMHTPSVFSPFFIKNPIL
jgi:hypothetical protein